MADILTAALHGERRVQRKFRSLERKTAKKLVRQSLRDGGRVVLAEAKNLAPVATGALRDSIKLRALKQKGSFGVQVQTGTRSELGIDPGDEYYYPAAVEFGHPAPGREQAPAHPFLRPALDNKAVSAFRVIRSSLIARIEAEGARR